MDTKTTKLNMIWVCLLFYDQTFAVWVCTSENIWANKLTGKHFPLLLSPLTNKITNAHTKPKSYQTPKTLAIKIVWLSLWKKKKIVACDCIDFLLSFDETKSKKRIEKKATLHEFWKQALFRNRCLSCIKDSKTLV